MDPLVQLGLVVAAFFAGRIVIGALRRPQRGVGDPAASAQLRHMVLTLSAEKIGAEPVQGVYGVVMDLAAGGGAATVIGLVDGTASCYFSTGGGVLGAGQHAPVKRAAMHLNRVAAGFKGALARTIDFELPADGRVKLFLTTTEGVLGAEDEETALQRPEHALHALYVAAQELLTTIRESSS